MFRSVCCDVIATIRPSTLTTFPRTCATTYLFSMLLCHSNRHAPTRDACRFGTYLVTSGCTYGLNTVSFHSIGSEVSFAAVSAQGFARPLAGLLATHLAIVYSVYSAYLPGLLAARPSAFAEGEGFEPPNRLDDCRVSGAVLSTSQPTFLFLYVAMVWRPPPYISGLQSPQMQTAAESYCVHKALLLCISKCFLGYFHRGFLIAHREDRNIKLFA